MKIVLMAPNTSILNVLATGSKNKMGDLLESLIEN